MGNPRISQFSLAFDIGAGIFKSLAKAVIDAGGSDEDLRRIETDQSLRESLATIITTRQAMVVTHVKTAIVIGGKTRDELLAEFKSGGFKIGNRAWEMMAQRAFVTESEPCEINIAILSLRELGFPHGGTRSDAWSIASNRGFELCPPSVGPHLRLALPDQLPGLRFRIAMKPIIDLSGFPRLFVIECDDRGRWLCGRGTGSGVRLSPEVRFAFVVPRK